MKFYVKIYDHPQAKLLVQEIKNNHCHFILCMLNVQFGRVTSNSVHIYLYFIRSYRSFICLITLIMQFHPNGIVSFNMNRTEFKHRFIA